MSPPPPPPQPGQKRNPFKAIISGGITGGVEICITYPTEFVKTKMQLYPHLAKKGAIQCAKDTVHQYGVIGLYKGLSALLTFSIPKTAVRFGSNEALKNNVFKKKNRINTFMAGLGAGVCEAIFVVTPAETLKVKLIHDKLLEQPKYKGMIDGIRTIAAQQGLSGLYKGLTPTILKQGSNQGIRFLVYEDSKKIIKGIGITDIIANLLAGGIAGAASVFGKYFFYLLSIEQYHFKKANTPVDVIKTQMQGLEAHKYKNSLDCFFQILKNEGVKGLYKGTVPRLSRVVLDVAITFTLYEYITKAINYVWPDKH
ncbi:hypothetical protein ABPG72_014479 [Tetrahymena utriculariae]